MRKNFRFALAVLVFAAALAAAPAAWAIVLPPNFLPGDDTIGPEAGDQQAPAIGAGGNMILAAWADKRSYPSVVSSQFYEFETSSDIYAIRLDAAGSPIDAHPFPITHGRAAQNNPQISWNGTNWLVVYESTDLNGTGYYYQKSLEAVRVAPTGQVLDATPIKIHNVVPVGLFSWAVASNGQDWAVAFMSSDSNSALKLLAVTAAGVVQQPPVFAVPSTYYLRTDAKLAWAGGVYLFTWTDFFDTQALRFDASLNMLDSSPIMLLPYGLEALASDGSQFFITWQQQQPNFTQAVMGARVTTAGVRLDGAGLNISLNNEPQPYTTIATAWDGTDFRVTWEFNNAVSVARVSPAGTLLDPGGVSVPGPTAGPVAGLPGGGVQLVWSPISTLGDDVFSAPIPPSNVAGPNTVVSTGAPMQFRPDAATGAAGFMTVFRSDLSGVSRIMAQPLALDGTPLTPSPVLLASGPSNAGPGTPSVGWNGSVYLATWSDPTGLVAQRLAQDGSLVDPAPFAVTAGFGPTEVSAVGGDFLIVGRRFGFNIQIINTIAARVRGSDGAVLDPSGLIVGGSYSIANSVTTFGSRWLVVFRANVTHDNPIGATYGNFVNTDGTFGTVFQISNTSSSAGGNSIFEVAAASDGNKALVLQSAEVSSGSETDLVAVLVNPDGTHGAEINLTPWIGNQYAPRVAFDGTDYIVVFNDQKNRFAPFTLDQLDARGDLFGMRVATDGTAIDPQGFGFSLSPAAETHPNVAAGGGLSLLLGAIMRDAPFESYRIGYRLLGAGGNAWPVAVAAADSTGGDIPLTVGFDSTGSIDPDGVIVSYLWDFGDGTTSTSQNPVHTYTVPGDYVATLTVTDDQGVSSVNSARVGVTAPNILPVAVATANPTTGPAPLAVTLFGERSYDVDGALGNFEWTFSDGGTYYGSTAYHTFSLPGTHTATLTVFDNRFGTGTTTITIVATGANNPPLAPTGLGASAAFGNQAYLNWTDNSSNETGFTLERCTGTTTFCSANPASFAPIVTLAANTRNYYDNGVQPGMTYTWRVFAFNTYGNSGYSNMAEATTPSLPAAPTNLLGIVQSKVVSGSLKVRVGLKWTDNATTETGYTVERCAGASCTNFSPVIFLGPNTTKVFDYNIALATTYRYRVAATNAGGSAYSNIVTLTTP